MLISSFLLCALLLVQGAICSDLQQDTSSVNEKSSKQLTTDMDTDTYGYHHPPLPKVNEQKGSRREKSLNIDEQTTTQKTFIRSFKPRARPTKPLSTPSSEIPVQVIYETAPTTVPTTTLPEKTTKNFLRRRSFQPNTIKKIDIIESTSAPSDTTKDTVSDIPMVMKNDDEIVSTTKFPRRLRARFLNANKKIDIAEKSEAISVTSVTESVTEPVPKVIEKESASDVPTRKFQRKMRGRFLNSNKNIDNTEKTTEISSITTEEVTMTGDILKITKKDNNAVSTTKFPRMLRGRNLNIYKKVEKEEKIDTMNNVVTPSVTEDMTIFTEKDENYVSTIAPVSKRTRGRFLNTKNKIDIRQTTSETINIASENVTGDMETLKEKDKDLVLTTEFPKQSRGGLFIRNKKIVIRQTTAATSNIDTENSAEGELSLTKKGKNEVPTKNFPKRTRGSYFKKRTEIPTPKVKILEEKNFVYAHTGNFHYSYLGGDGTKISSEGSLRSYENNKTGEAMSGSVFYTDKDGNDYSLSYTADENGYRPVGAHLPTPPPLPPAIARALKYIAEKNKSTPLPTENE